MKKYLYILLSVCLMTVSCNDDISVYQDLVQEGEPVEFTLDFSVGNLQDKSIESRSGNDYTVNNIYLFIFEAKNGQPGMLKTKKFYNSTELNATIGNNVPSDNGSSSSSMTGKLNISTTQGESFIYAVANIDLNGASGEYDQTDIKESLGKLQVGEECFKDLEAISISYGTINNEILLRTTPYYLMSGMYQVPVNGKYTRKDQSCIIGPNGIVDDSGNKVDNGRIRLYRMDAWIDFNINAAEGITFTPTKYRMVNLPVKSRLIVGANDITTESSGDYVDNLEREIALTDGKYSFSFYMFENRKNVTEAGNDLNSWEYTHREVTTNDYEYVDANGNYINPTFKYAPADATYIEIEGHFSGTTKEDPFSNGKTQNPVSGTTKYRIHLGDFSNNDYSNFNTLRNYHYTYNVTIAGVDKIIVEVTTATDQDQTASGATGEILFQPSANNFVLDAHFEVKQFTVNISDLEGWNLDNQNNGIKTDFAYVTQTCYGESTGDYTQKISELDDIYWVEFVRNENGADSGYLPYNTTGNKMNVRELLKELHDWKKNGYKINDKKIESLTYTIFVDEYYYTNDKITKLGGTGKGSMNWKDFCNQPNRVMYIGQRRKYSQVSPSTLTESICFISQRSIQTIYNTDTSLTELTSAWGTETVNETPNVKKDDSGTINEVLASGNNNRQNGYANQYDIWDKKMSIGSGGETSTGDEWSTHINQTNNKMASEEFKSIYACLLRNRDEDANGKIDAAELKWYLPAIYQYGDLYLGELGIEPEARQYYGKSTWTYDIHMLSSTFENNAQYRNLAEEGFAFSNSDYDIKDKDGKVTNDIEKLQLRCVRNLGGDASSSFYDEGGEAAKAQVTSYVKKLGNTINLDYLNDASKRQTYRTNELPAEHSHLSLHNNVYNQFEYGSSFVVAYADEVAYGKRNANATNPNESILSGHSSYGTGGWRAPSQRELMILVFQGVFAQTAGNALAATDIMHDSTDADGNAIKVSDDTDESWILSRTAFEWGGIMARREWITYPNTWEPFTGKDHLGNEINTNYYWWRPVGQDPDNDGTYRYTYGTLLNGTTFGLKQLDNYALTKGRLLPVRDVQ